MEFFNMLNALNKTKNVLPSCVNTHDCINRLTVNQEITRKISEKYNIQSMNVRRKAEKTVSDPPNQKTDDSTAGQKAFIKKAKACEQEVNESGACLLKIKKRTQ